MITISIAAITPSITLTNLLSFAKMKLMTFKTTAAPLTNGYIMNPATGISHRIQAITSTKIETIYNIIAIFFCRALLSIKSSFILHTPL